MQKNEKNLKKIKKNKIQKKQNPKKTKNPTFGGLDLNIIVLNCMNISAKLAKTLDVLAYAGMAKYIQKALSPHHTV